jgi:subtilisin family serine protease
LPFLKDADPNVRFNSVIALERIGTEAAVVPLMAALSDHNEGVRKRAASAISRLWRPSTIEIVVELLGYQDPTTRNAAFQVLEEIGLEGIPEIERALEGAEPRIQAAGREAIGKILINEHVMKKIGALESHELLEARRGMLGAPSVVVALVGAGVDRSVPDIDEALIDEVNHLQDSGEPHISTTMSARLIVGSPSSDIAGVAPGVRLLSERVLSAEGSGDYETIVEGFRHAAGAGAKIIYADFGGPAPSETLRKVADETWEAGCLTVAPAGNEGTEMEVFPAAFDSVLAVAATDADDRKTPYSGFGSWVDVSAPGDPVRPGDSADIGPGGLRGTSFSGALVAGTAALIWSLDDSLNNQDVRSILLESTDDSDRANPSLHGKLGSGRVNVLKAVRSVLDSSPSRSRR